MSANEQVSVKVSFTKEDGPLLEVQKQLNQFAKTLQAGFTLDLGAKGAEWLLEVPQRLAEIAQKGVEYAESVTNMSVETRTTTDVMQVLMTMANQAGIEVGKLTGAVQQMSLNAEQAVNHVPKLADAFNDLHLNAQQFSALAVPLQLEALAKAGADAGWSTQALNDLSEILGKKNLPALLPILHKLSGPEGFKGLADAAVEAGQVASSATIEMADKIAEAQKATAQKWQVAYADWGASAGGFLDTFENKLAGIAQKASEVKNHLGALAGTVFAGTGLEVLGIGYDAATAKPKQKQGFDMGTGNGAAQQSEASRAAQAKAADTLIAKDEEHNKQAHTAYLEALKALDVLLETVDKEDKRDIAEATREAKKEAIFSLETKIQAAEQAGDTAKANGLKLDLERLQHEGMTASILNARLAVLKQEQDRKAQITQVTALEIPLQEQAREIEQQRAIIASNRSLTQADRDAKLNANAEEYRAILAKIVALETARAKLATDPVEIAQLKAEIARLQAEAGRYGAKQAPERRGTREEQSARTLSDSQDPSRHFQSGGSGATGALDEIAAKAQSVGDILHNVISGMAQSLQGGIAGAIDGLINRTEKWGQAIRNIGRSVYESVIKSFADTVAQQIVTTAAQVAIHSTGEAAKTAATGTGAAARGAIGTGETVFHIIQVGIRTAVHIAGEVAKTASTLIQAGIRITTIIAESIASIIQAAAGAMSAMASIPYVGPFLAIGAMAAILGAGMALVKGVSKGFKDGGHTGPGGSDEEAGPVHRNEWVAPAWMVNHPIVGHVVNGLERFRRGAISAGQLSESIVGGLAGRARSVTRSIGANTEGGGSGGSTSLSVGIYDNRQSMLRDSRKSRNRMHMMETLRSNRGEFFA